MLGGTTLHDAQLPRKRATDASVRRRRNPTGVLVRSSSDPPQRSGVRWDQPWPQDAGEVRGEPGERAITAIKCPAASAGIFDEADHACHHLASHLDTEDRSDALPEHLSRLLVPERAALYVHGTDSSLQ